MYKTQQITLKSSTWRHAVTAPQFQHLYGYYRPDIFAAESYASSLA